MAKLAFVFSGQGAQYSGMGKALCEKQAAAAAVYRQADALRPGTSDQCFSASAEELAETKNTQPCMFTMELAAAAALSAAGVSADMAAGFSLGELAALTFAGGLSFPAGFQLVTLRGRLMQAAAEQADTGMAAVLRLDDAQVEALCAKYSQVYPVNYNCPGQVSVAGLKEQLAPFMQDVKAAGGRALPLKVRGAFHSPFMAPAAEEFAKALQGLTFQQPEVELYSDFTGKPYSAGDFAQLLAMQIKSPVRWRDIIGNMIAAGADTFVELGPGTTLCGLIGKIDKNVRCFHVEDEQSLQETVQGVRGC